MRSALHTWLTTLALLAACNPTLSLTDGAGADARDAQPPPATDAAGARCVISADCPSGTHCDLGECIQDCNLVDPCTGQRTCTPRGRCVAQGQPEQDPAPHSPEAQFAMTPGSLALEQNQSAIALTLAGRGVTRYRVETTVPWLRVAPARGTFTDTGMLQVQVDTAAVPLDGSVGLVRVYSEQGEATAQVVAPIAMQGNYRGTLTYDHVRVTDVTGTTTDAALTLGTTQIGLGLQIDHSVVSVRVDPTRSLLWPASAGVSPEGTGTIAGGSIHAVISQLFSTLHSLFPLTSPSIFESRPIGRELDLQLTSASAGILSGVAIETIYGLTSTPLRIVGRIDLRRSPGDVSGLVVGSPPTMPPGPTRGAGTPLTPTPCPSECAASLTTTYAGRQACVLRSLEAGFPLHRFYETTPIDGSFGHMGNATTPNNPFPAAIGHCESERGALRGSDYTPAAVCVNPQLLDCARYFGATLFAETSAERMLSALNVAQAWGELFQLSGNDAMVRAYQQPYSSTNPTLDMETQYGLARRSYDAGLWRIFRPELLEELRGVRPMQAAASGHPALASIGRLLAGSIQATSEVVDIQRAGEAADTVAALRDRVVEDSLIQWFATAIVADLDGRWRTGPDPAPEVASLGAVLTILDHKVASFDPNVNPLGIPRSYVPLLAPRSPTDVDSNFDRLLLLARDDAARVQADDGTALNARNRLDGAADQAMGEITQARTRYEADLQAVCGNDFVQSGVVQSDLALCGATAGGVRDAMDAARASAQELQIAQQRVEEIGNRIRLQRQLAINIHNIREADIAFSDSTGMRIGALERVRVGLAAAEAAIHVAANAQLWNFGAPMAESIIVATVNALAGELAAEQSDLARAEGLHAAVSSANIEYMRDMAAIQELMIQQEGARQETILRAMNFTRALGVISNLREQVLRDITQWREAIAYASRPFLNDPSFRVVRDATVERARADLRQGRQSTYLAARALEYAMNTPMPSIAGLVFQAQNGAALDHVDACLSSVWSEFRRASGMPSDYVTEVSVRRDVLGITGPRTDADTGAVISPAAQFRASLFAQPFTFQGHVWPAIRFGTSLMPERGLFSSLVCNDRITGIEAQLVGDFLGDNQADLYVLADGATLLRSCATSDVTPWSLRPSGQPAPADIQAGVNSYGTTTANNAFNDFGVAESSWIVAVPDGVTVRNNLDVDPTHIDDIVLRVHHRAITTPTGGISFTPACP